MIVTTRLLPMTTYHHFALTIRQRTLIGAHLVAVPIEGRAVARSRHGVGSMPISMAGGFAERSKKGRAEALPLLI
jgi:hypothetical protein